MTAAEQVGFGVVLRRARLAAGLTQEELAERANLSVRAIASLEQGTRRSPHRHTLQVLADALGLADSDREHFEAAARSHGGAAHRDVEVHPDSSPMSAQTFRMTDLRDYTVYTHERNDWDARIPPLPAQLTPFVGRQREVQEVSQLVRRPQVRLLTLTGPGGTGKTRLALQVAREVLDAFPDGLVFVPLASLADPALLPSTLATTLKVKEVSAQPIMDSLAEHLREKRLLLVLDTFEHVLPAAEAISHLLTACPRLTILVTSRAALHLAAEHEYPVPPLPVPTPVHSLQIEALSQYEAVQLFVQRVQTVKPDFQLAESNASAVAETCRRLEGLPLGIELAAARVKVLPPPALLARLERPLQILTGGPRDLPARQQTMRNTIAWSYDLLNTIEQALVRRLAVFTGSFTLEAAEPICNAPSHLDLDFLQGLSSLVDQSLLRVQEHDPDADDPEPRFIMLDTIREYGLEQLAHAGEDESVRRAHALWYLALAKAAEPELRGTEQRFWLGRLESEYANLQAALQWAQQQREPEIGLRVATALWRFWSKRGEYTEGRSWVEALLQLEQRMGHPVPPLLQAKALNELARLVYRQGDLERAVALARESLALYRSADDKAGIASSLSTMGAAMKDEGDYKDAIAALEESLALRRELGDTTRIASALNLLGGAIRWQRQDDRAESYLQEALELSADSGDTASVAHNLLRLAETALDQHAVQRSRRLYEESLAMQSDLEDREGIGFALNGLALVAHVEGDFERAAELARQSVALFREVGAKRHISCMLETLARIEFDEGKVERAAASWFESLTLARAVRARELMPDILEGLGRVAAKRGDQERAAGLYAAGAALRDSHNTPPAGFEREGYERAIGEIRLALGEEAFAAAWQAGGAMTVEQATAYALGETGPALA